MTDESLSFDHGSGTVSDVQDHKSDLQRRLKPRHLYEMFQHTCSYDVLTYGDSQMIAIGGVIVSVLVTEALSTTDMRRELDCFSELVLTWPMADQQAS